MANQSFKNTGLAYDTEHLGGAGLQVRLLTYLVSLSAHKSPQILEMKRNVA